MSEKNNYHNLILKYLKGKISKSETSQLVEWLNSDPRNKDYFHHIKKEWNPRDHADENTEDAFKELQSKLFLHRSLKNQIAPSGYSTKHTLINISKAAVILAIGIIAGYFWKKTPVENKKKQSQYTEIETSRGQRSTITLPDSTKIWLNSASTLRFASGNFNKNREVHLQGEAFFEVKPLRKGIFTVKTSDYHIHVSGTAFNVRAYEEAGYTETSLVEGKVTVDGHGRSIQLSPKEKLIYQSDHFTIQKGNIYPSTAWKEGVFCFDQTSLKKLITRLERWYNVEIHLSTPELENIEYSGVFKNDEKIREVLDVIKMTTPIEYHFLNHQTIQITHKSNPKTHKPMKQKP
jgi:ferric-dicitrate binding protein FerR (iron transport regulator)